MLRFLSKIWNLQEPPTGSYVFQATKDFEANHWADHPRVHSTDESQLSVASAHDLYFCPNAFSANRRLRKFALPGRWLYADLDEVDPTTLDIPPTLAWETSPLRYQAMWLLSDAIPPRRLERLNQRMTYYTGADKGGWSLTKVLRVPGSISTKYGTASPFRVQLVTRSSAMYDPRDLERMLEHVTPAVGTHNLDPGMPDLDTVPSFEDAWKLHAGKLPFSVKRMIRISPDDAAEHYDRSAALYELEGRLLKLDIPPEHVLALIRRSGLNKYYGQDREVRMLWAEIQKQVPSPKGVGSGSANSRSSTASGNTASPRRRTPNARNRIGDELTGLLPNYLPYREFMSKDWPKPEWLIEGFWTKGAYGILAGEYKSFKSMILLAMALSVASGKPFLNKYTVAQGGVEYIHEEGRPWSVHDRLTRIAGWMGLGGTPPVRTPDGDFEFTLPDLDLPIGVTSLPRLNLTDEDHQQALLRHVRITRPRLVILETFYLLSGGVSENDASEVRIILEFLSNLSHATGAAVILSHHFHKSSDDRRLFDRVSGSNVFLRWYESGIFVERTGDESDNAIQIVASHRDGKGTEVALRFDWDGDDDGESFDVEFLDQAALADLDAAQTVIDFAKADTPDRYGMQPWPRNAPLLEAAALQPFGFWVEDMVKCHSDCGKDRPLRDSSAVRRHLSSNGWSIEQRTRDGKQRLWAVPPSTRTQAPVLPGE